MSEKKEKKKTDPRIILIAERIKKLRIDAGYSNYEEFAWEHNIGRMQYWNMEKGSNITMITLFKIVDAHKITLSEFFEGIKEE